MSFIEWKNEYLTNITLFDDQHKMLFRLINELYNGVLACHTIEEEREITHKILAELIQYAEEHFRAEEDLLQRCSYPYLDEHKSEHRKFCLRVEQLIREYDANFAGLSNDVFIFLRDWITDHVIEADKRYVKFLVARGEN